MVPLWMLPQALVAGNAFILKPSEQTPLSVIALGELFREAGLPDGIFQVVQGGREAVEALCDHPGIGAFGFVGSTRVAKLVYGRACMTASAPCAWAAPRTTSSSSPTPTGWPPATSSPASPAAPASAAWPPPT